MLIPFLILAGSTLLVSVACVLQGVVLGRVLTRLSDVETEMQGRQR